MVRCFDRLSITTNGINNLPFVLSLSKDLFSVSLAYGNWLPFFPAPVANLYNMLQSGFGGASFKAMAITLLIFGGLASFFAFLIYPQHKTN